MSEINIWRLPRLAKTVASDFGRDGRAMVHTQAIEKRESNPTRAVLQ